MAEMRLEKVNARVKTVTSLPYLSERQMFSHKAFHSLSFEKNNSVDIDRAKRCGTFNDRIGCGVEIEGR